MNTSTSKIVILIYLALCAQQSFAEEARVACMNFLGQITVHEGQCPIGQDLVKVMDSPSSPSSHSIEVKVACMNFLGQVTVHEGQCPLGQDLVKIMD